ncbi:MAG TPA: hypothetical protein VGI04_09080 [Neobacillus sp.]
MAIWWGTTIGFILCLGFIGVIFFHFLSGALHSEDSKRIDPEKKVSEKDC